MKKHLKLWCVAVTDADDCHNPNIHHVYAKTQKSAIKKVLNTLEITKEEVESSAEYDVLAFEVKDIIE